MTSEPNMYSSYTMVEQAEVLAKRWMPGLRQNATVTDPRKAWEHPQDLVRLLAERPGEFSEAGQKLAVAIAWLHDVLEDGVKENGNRVMPDDFKPFLINHDNPVATPIGAALDPRVLEGVLQLTHREGQPKTTYYESLKDIGYIPKLVKCVDRICNLREGVDWFSDARWARYSQETRDFILPLAPSLRDETAEWLTRLLNEALDARGS